MLTRLIAFTTLLVLSLSLGSLHVGAARAQIGQRAGDIVDSLLPDGTADHRLLRRFKRADAVNALREEQGRAKGGRAAGIAYLLAYLKYEYPANRKKALDAFQGCLHRSATIECDENTASYLIALFERGDNKLLKPLLDAGPASDGALAELLGPFYGKLLWKNSLLMLQTLKRLSEKDQWRIGVLAATGDGSGLGSVKMVRDIQLVLGRYAQRKADPLSQVARNCLSGFRAGLKALKQGN